MPTYYIAHHGIKGQQWGVRRWQNEDGSLTTEGRVHYGYGVSDEQKKDAEILKKLGQDKFTESQEFYRIKNNKKEFLSKATNKIEKKELKKEYARKFKEAQDALAKVVDKKYIDVYDEIQAGKSKLRRLVGASFTILNTPIPLLLIDEMHYGRMTTNVFSGLQSAHKVRSDNKKELKAYKETLKEVEKNNTGGD